MQHGVYDEVDEVDPVVLERYYGAKEPGESDRPGDLGSIPGDESNPDDDNQDSGSSLDLDGGLESDGSQIHMHPDSEEYSDPEDDSDLEDEEDGSDAGSRSDDEFSDDGSEGCADVEVNDIQEVSWVHITEIIAKAQGRNIRHDAAEVASSDTPFRNKDEGAAFAIAFREALNADSYPEGFNLSDDYEPSESYRTGRSSRPISIPLPYNVWFPRIVVWCKALDTLKHIEVARETFYD